MTLHPTPSPPSLPSLVQASNAPPPHVTIHTPVPPRTPIRPSDSQILTSTTSPSAHPQRSSFNLPPAQLSPGRNTARGILVTPGFLQAAQPSPSSTSTAFQPPSSLVKLQQHLQPSPAQPICSECGILAVLRCHECSEDQCLAHFKALHKGGKRADHLWTAYHSSGVGSSMDDTRTVGVSGDTEISLGEPAPRAAQHPQTKNGASKLASKGRGGTGFNALRSAWSTSTAPLSLSSPTSSPVSPHKAPPVASAVTVKDRTSVGDRQAAASEAFVKRLATKTKG